MLWPHNMEGETTPQVVETPVSQKIELTIREKVELVFRDSPRMVAVLNCESRLRQFDSKGKPLVSRTHDYGVSQINHIHLATTTKMGLDVINNVDDNLTYARLLFDRYGYKPLTCSKKISWKKKNQLKSQFSLVKYAIPQTTLNVTAASSTLDKLADKY